MDWLGLALALVKLVGAFTNWLHDKQMIDAGQSKQIAKELESQHEVLVKAIKAREAVRADAAAHPDRVQDNDGFRRD
jgi:hypothetical protein